MKVLHNDGTYKSISSDGLVYPNNDTLLNGHGVFEKV